MFLVQQFAPGLVAAELLSIAALVLAFWLGRGGQQGPAVALALGYFGGHVVSSGWPQFPAHESTDWLAWFAVAAALVAVLDSTLSLGNRWRSLIWILICAGLLRVLLNAGFQHHWTAVEGILWIAGLAAGMLFLTWCFERTVRDAGRPFLLPLILTVVAVGTCVTMGFSGSFVLTQLASVFAASSGMVFVMAVLFPVFVPDSLRIAPVGAVLLAGLVTSGRFYADMPAASALLLWLAPAVVLIPMRGAWPAWKWILLKVGLACGAVAAAALIAMRASPPFPY